MSDDAEPRIREMMNLIPPDWDQGPLGLVHEIRRFLKETVADEGTALDSGGGDGSADLWVTVEGVEYYVTVRRSNNQLMRDGKSLPGNEP